VLDFAADAIPAVGSRELGIQLDAGAEAPRYLGRVIEGVDAPPTPLWMAERLRRSGVRPVSLLVDITQYVMLELGQPMHAYDLGTLQGSIAVRRSRAGETLKLLDGRDARWTTASWWSPTPIARSAWPA
jgi:phenylalanyl-tRNA synthetase beta chain